MGSPPPTEVAADDSGVWVTSQANDTVQRFDPAGRPLGTLQYTDGILDGPTAIVVGPSGVWIGSDLEAAIARIDPAIGTVDRIALGGITGDLVVDVDGDVWVAVRAQTA